MFKKFVSLHESSSVMLYGIIYGMSALRGGLNRSTQHSNFLVKDYSVALTG